MRQLLPDAPEKRAQDSREAAAEEDCMCFEEMNHVPQPDREQIRGGFEHLSGERISLTKSFRDRFCLHPFQIAAGKGPHDRSFTTGLGQERAGSSRDCRTGAEHFDAPALSASASRSAIIDRDMAAFRRASGAAVVDSLVKHDSSSYACAQRGVKDATVTRPSAPDGFGKRRGVSVVVHARRNPKNTLHPPPDPQCL